MDKQKAILEKAYALIEDRKKRRSGLVKLAQPCRYNKNNPDYIRDHELEFWAAIGKLGEENLKYSELKTLLDFQSSYYDEGRTYW